MSTCRVCGRQLDETQDHAPMPCVCAVLPALDDPFAPTNCPTCNEPLRFHDPYWCGRCEREV
jgi:hypothetical protein